MLTTNMLTKCCRNGVDAAIICSFTAYNLMGKEVKMNTNDHNVLITGMGAYIEAEVPQNVEDAQEDCIVVNVIRKRLEFQ